MTALEILTDEPPFGAKTRGTKIIQMIGTNERSKRAGHPKIEGYEQSDQIWQLFEECWRKKPEDRPNAREVTGRIKPFVRFDKKNDPNVQKPPEPTYPRTEYGRTNPVVQQGTVPERHELGRATKPIAQGQQPPSGTGGGDKASQPTLPVPPELNDSEPVEKHRVTSQMSIAEALALLFSHGYQEVTGQIQFDRCDDIPYAGGGFGDIYRGFLHNGSKIAIKCPRIYSASGRGDYCRWAIAREG